MKTIMLLLFTILISLPANAAQTCESYITDKWSSSRYDIEIIMGDNVVTDSATGLMWKQCSEGLTGLDCMTGVSSSHSWQQALDLSGALNNKSGFAGYNDWRIPNQKELRTIVARNCYDPSINEAVFPRTPLSWFWSSSPGEETDGSEDSVWTVYFDKGFDGNGDRNDEGKVRLVRSL